MNKYSSIIHKLGAILQSKKATKEEVAKAYKNTDVVFDKKNKRLNKLH